MILKSARHWDQRLTRRGVDLVPANETGSHYWRVVRAEYIGPQDTHELGGRQNIYFDVLDGNGQRMVGMSVEVTNGGQSIIQTQAKPGEAAACDFPMWEAGHAYNARMHGGLSSDEVRGLGLGTPEDPYTRHHVSYLIVFQRTEANGDPVDPEPPPNNLLSHIQAIRRATAAMERIIRGEVV